MKKLLSLFLSAVMLLSCASQTVFAATTALTETELEALETPLLKVFSDSDLPTERVTETPSKYLFKAASGDDKQYILLKNVNSNVSDKSEDVYFVMTDGYTQKGAAYNATPYGATAKDPGTKTANDTKFDAEAENSLAKAMNQDSYLTTYFPAMNEYIKTNTWYTEAGYEVDAYSTSAKIALLSLTEYAQNVDRIGLKPNGETLQWWLRSPHIQANTKYSVWEFIANGKLSHAWNLNSTYIARVVRPCFYIGESFFKEVKLDMALLKTEGNAVADIIKEIASTEEGLTALKETYTEAELAELGISAGGVQITSATLEGSGQCGKALTATVVTEGEATKTEYEWILDKDGVSTTLATTEENTYTVAFADLGASIKCFVKVYNGETLSHTAYTNAIATETKPVLPAYNAIVDGAVAETPAQYKFTVDGKEMILLESVNAGENDGQFITLEDPVNDSSLIWYEGLTADMGFMYDPADSKSIAAKINSEDYYNNIISANVAPYVNIHRWWNEPVNTTVTNGDVKDAYATESKLALLSYTEYAQNASRIGYKTDNTIATLLRTPQYNWNGPRKGNLRVLLISTVDDADANTAGVQRMTAWNTSNYETYGSYYLKSIGFYVNPDMFANVKIGFTAENTEVITILREKLAGKELEDLRAIGYSDDEIRMLFPDMEIVPPPVFPTYTSILLNGTATDGVKDTPAQYKFAVDGREMILLKSVNATEKDGQFVTLEVPVSDTSIVYYDMEDASELAKMTDVIYDPEDEKSMAWDVNQTSLWDKEIKASASGAKAKVIPDSVRGYLNTHKWWNEGISNAAGGYTKAAWTTKSKVAVLSYTEYIENIDRIGWYDENGCAMVTRTPRYDSNASAGATASTPNFLGISTAVYEEGKTKYRFSHIPVTSGKELTYLGWHSKPIGFYLNPQFFADVKVDFSAENTEVIAILREKLSTKTVEELLNMGYSYSEIKLLFPSYASAIEDVEMYDFSLTADTETAGKYTVTYVCENTTDTAVTANPVLAVYNGTQLISADVKAEAVEIATGEPATVSFTFEIGAADTANVSIKTFVWDAQTLYPYAAAKENELLSLRDKTWQAASTDADLTYYGRWEETSTAALANWNNPYVKFDFTGTTLKADFEGVVNISYEIDGEVKTASGVSGSKVLASGLSDTLHTAQITITNANSTNGIKSVETSEGGDISKTTEEKKYIQFIGDSITTDPRSYSYTIPKTYDYDYSIISMSGIALQDGAGWYYSSTGQVWSGLLAREDSVGMESAYFATKSPKYGYSVNADGALQYANPVFDVANDHAPDVIVIGLGTNDSAYVRNNTAGVAGAEFTQTYIDFVNNLNNLYPNAEIYILRQFNNVTDNGSGKNLSADYDAMRQATEAAVEALSSNAKVHYVDTSAWEVGIHTDNVHPSADGYAALRDLVYNSIKGSLE